MDNSVAQYETSTPIRISVNA